VSLSPAAHGLAVMHKGCVRPRERCRAVPPPGRCRRGRGRGRSGEGCAVGGLRRQGVGNGQRGGHAGEHTLGDGSWGRPPRGIAMPRTTAQASAPAEERAHASDGADAADTRRPSDALRCALQPDTESVLCVCAHGAAYGRAVCADPGGREPFVQNFRQDAYPSRTV